MCHLLLILPLVALPVLWLWPLSVALPAYVAALGLSALIYWYAIRAMRQPRQNAAEGLIGQSGHIVWDRFGEPHVQIRSELWQVMTISSLREGELVKVVAAQDTKLRVERVDRCPSLNEMARNAKAATTAKLTDAY